MNQQPRTLASTVFVHTPDGATIECPAGSTPPSELAALITNPAAWSPVEVQDDAASVSATHQRA